MNIVFYVAMTIAVISTIPLVLKKGWVALWNGFFVFILIFVLVVAQKHIGQIEGLLIAVVPFVAGQILINKNRKVNTFYFSKQTRFISWCNKYIYYLSAKKDTK